MNLQEMYSYTEREVQKQGSASSKVLAPLLKSMIEYMSENGAGLIETNPITIESQASEVGNNFSLYKVNNAQSEIDSVIGLVNSNNQKARIVAYDNKLTILFPFMEYSNDSVTAIATAHDGYYYLHLDSQADGSYLTHYSFTNAIAPVTEGEIEVYKKLFNADYDKASNKFSVLVGSTIYNLPPADMIMTDAFTSAKGYLEYVKNHGFHFTDALAEHASKMTENMSNQQHTWTVSQAKKSMENLGLSIPSHVTYGDATYAANMYYADFYPDPLKDEASCLRAAYRIANDPDGYEGMIFRRWTADAIGKSLSINWEDFI